jgi:hypothetical protein
MAFVKDFVKNPSETIRVERTTYKDKEYISARIYVTDDDGKLIPTKKGLSLEPSLAAKVAKEMVVLAGEQSTREE